MGVKGIVQDTPVLQVVLFVFLDELETDWLDHCG